MNITNALEAMKQGSVMTNGKALFAHRNGKVWITGRGWTLRSPVEDFLELYGDDDFIEHVNMVSVDEESDEQYYGRLQVRQ